jgi:hypothetical protein
MEGVVFHSQTGMVKFTNGRALIYSCRWFTVKVWWARTSLLMIQIGCGLDRRRGANESEAFAFRIGFDGWRYMSVCNGHAIAADNSTLNSFRPAEFRDR